MPVSLVILILYIVALSCSESLANRQLLLCSLSAGMLKNVVKETTKTLLLRDADFLRL